MLSMEEASARAIAGPVTVGALRALIAPKTASNEPASVDPTATLAEAAARYLAHFAGRPDEDVIVLRETRPFGIGTQPTRDGLMALSILRDFGD